jgi:cell division protein ZapE
VAARLARRVRVLCLDEFNVVDIGDAMILAGLLKALFAEGIVLVTTSNHAPDDLYPSGIQRASFLPAIDLLNRHMRVVHLTGQRDHRRRVLEQSLLYLTPADTGATQRIAHEFGRLAQEPTHQNGILEINGRPMPYLRKSDGMVWFDFEALCGPPRSQHDYIELARTHHTVFLSGIPPLDDEQVDRTRRFIFVIDEFYDRRVKLLMSAAAPFDRLYSGERLRFEFQRTASRLQEMQTSAWLARAHRG